MSVHHTTKGVSATSQGSSITAAALHPQHRKSAVRRWPCTRRGQEIPQWVQVSAWDVSDCSPDQLGGAQAVSRAGHWSSPLPSALRGWGASVLTLDPLVFWARGPMGRGRVSRGRAVTGPGFPVSTRSRASPLPRIQSKRALWAGCH